MKNKKPKFNLIDGLIVFLIIAIVAVGGLMAFKVGIFGDDKKENLEITYKVEFLEYPKALADAFKKEEGKTVWLGEKEPVSAILKEVKVTPARRTITNIETGEYVWADVPEYYDVVLTLVSKAHKTDEAIVVKNMDVRVGAALAVNGKDCTGYGYVTNLDVKELYKIDDKKNDNNGKESK